MTDLSKPQKKILEAAAARPDGAIHPLPDGIKGGAALKVIKALSSRALIEDAGNNDWRIAAEGFQAIGHESPTEAASHADESDALTALFEQIALDHLFIDTLTTRKSDSLDFHSVSVWGVKSALEAAYQAGRKSVGAKRVRKTAGPRDGSKQEMVLTLLRRPEGATLRQMEETTDWQPHSIRGFLSGTIKKKLGLTIAAEKVAADVPDNPGGRGSYTVYRIAS